MTPLGPTPSPDLEGTTTTPQKGVGSPDAVVENPVLEGVLLADGKRTNGRTVFDQPQESLSDQALDARDSLGSRASVSETDAGSSAAAAAHTCVGINWARSSNARKNDRNFTLLYMLFPPFSRFLPFLCAVTTV